MEQVYTIVKAKYEASIKRKREVRFQAFVGGDPDFTRVYPWNSMHQDNSIVFQWR